MNNFSIGDEVRGDILLDAHHIKAIYVKGIITKDLGDKVELDVTQNSTWTLSIINKYYAKENYHILGKYEQFCLDTFKVIRTPQTLMSCPKEFLRPPRILICEEEWFAPHFKAKQEKTTRKEIGYYGCGGTLGYRFEADGKYGFLQDTFDKLMNGEVDIHESRSGRWQKLIYRSKRYFAPETIEFYNKNNSISQ